MLETDTIIAQTSPPGRGGVSIIRLSGTESLSIASKLFKKDNSFFQNRQAQFVSCYSDGAVVDEGLSLCFKTPQSFTGENVIEFHICLL